ncbi:MAG: putative ABC transporter permease subunit [Candidatus Aquicultor sp.]
MSASDAMLVLLLKLRLRILLNTFRLRASGSSNVGGAGEALKVLLFPLFGLIFISLSFSAGFALFSLTYKTGGEAAVTSVVSSMFIGVFIFTLFSALVTAFYTLFSSPDLSIWITAPVPLRTIFVEKSIEVMLSSSGFYAVMFLPALLGLGLALHAGPLFYFAVLLISPVFLMIPTGFGMMAIMFLARFIRFGKAKEIIGAIGGIAGLLFYIASQLLPGQIGHQGSKATGIVQVVSKIRLKFLPTDWVAQLVVKSGLAQYSDMLLPGIMVLTLSISIFTLALVFTQSAYYTGLTNISDAGGAKKRVKDRARAGSRPFALSGPIGAIVRKDIKCLKRDTQEWIQLLWPLAAMFIFMFRVNGDQSSGQPFGTGSSEAIFSAVFLVLLMSMFAIRLSLTGLSRELKSAWIIHQAPVARSNIVIAKLIVAYLPSLILAESAYIIIALIKGFPLQMVILGIMALAGILLGSNAIGIMLGSMYPKFDAKNPKEMVGARGGYLFMGLNIAYIVISLGLAALPQLGRLIPIDAVLLWALSAIVLYAFAGACTVIAIKIASKRLERLEITV